MTPELSANRLKSDYDLYQKLMMAIGIIYARRRPPRSGARGIGAEIGIGVTRGRARVFVNRERAPGPLSVA
jgi:hypothetical protein